MNTVGFDSMPVERPDTVNSLDPLDYLRVFWWMFTAPERLERIWRPDESATFGRLQLALFAILRRDIALIVWLPTLIVMIWIINQEPRFAICLLPAMVLWLTDVFVTAEVHIPNLELPGRVGGRMMMQFVIMQVVTRVAVMAGLSGIAASASGAMIAAGAVWLLLNSLHLLAWGLARGHIDTRIPLLASAQPGQGSSAEAGVAFSFEQGMASFILATPLVFVVRWIFPFLDTDDENWTIFVVGIAAMAAAVFVSQRAATVIGQVFNPDRQGVVWSAIRWSLLLMLIGSFALLLWLTLGGWKLL